MASLGELASHPLQPAARHDRRRTLALVVFGFFALALVVRAGLDRTGGYPLTGDEPHYLVLASSLVEQRTVNVEQALEAELRDHTITDAWPPGAASVPREDTKNSHLVEGRDGRFYSVHGLGLSVLLALPFSLGGGQAARLAMMVMACGIPVLAWLAAGLHGLRGRIQVAATVVVSGCVPFLTAANQVFPDLPAGVLLGVAVLACTWLVLAPGSARLSGGVVAAAGGLALLPWLHMRLSAPGLLLAVAMAWWARRRGTSRRGAVALLAPMVVSLLGLLLWHLLVFGRLAGPYGAGGALEVGSTGLMVLLGLHLDQFHGIFVQQPALLLGVAALLASLRRTPGLALVVVAVWASITVPNALHPNWYGGYSFAGRFAWSAAVVLVVPTMGGFAWLWHRPRAFAAVVTGLGAWSVWAVGRAATGDLLLYNQATPTPVTSYGSWLTPFGRWMPSFYDVGWAWRSPANAVAVVLVTALVAGLAVRMASDRPSPVPSPGAAPLGLQMPRPGPMGRGVDLG